MPSLLGSIEHDDVNSLNHSRNHGYQGVCYIAHLTVSDQSNAAPSSLVHKILILLTLKGSGNLGKPGVGFSTCNETVSHSNR